MTKERYVKEVIKLLQCSKMKKKEIRDKLSADMDSALQNGESMQQVIERMGTAEEMAAEFNESFTTEEKKKAKSGKVGKVLGIIASVAVVLIVLFLLLVPVSTSIGNSGRFSEDEVNAKVIETINLLDANDYDMLMIDANAKFVNAVTAESLESAKNQIASEWGIQENIGTVYCVEVGTILQHYVTAQVNVEYENAMVTYTLTYDQDMKLAGLYMK